MARQTSMPPDWFMLGLTTGVAAGLVKSAVNCALRRAGIPTVPYSSFAGGWVQGRRPRLWGFLPGDPRTRGEKVLGHVADTLYGGLFGLGISYVIHQTPPGNEVIKGAIGGGALWASITASLNQWRRPRRFSNGEMATLLAMNLLYGALQGALIGQCRAKAAGRSDRRLGLVAATGVRRLDEGLSNTLD